MSLSYFIYNLRYYIVPYFLLYFIMSFIRTLWYIGYFILGLFFFLLEVTIISEFVGNFLAFIIVIFLAIPFTIFLPVLAYFAYGTWWQADFIIQMWIFMIFYHFVGYLIGIYNSNR